MTTLQFAPSVLDRGALLRALRAFKRGDFSVRLPMDLIGVDGEIAAAFNEVVELNEVFANEIARIRDEVGKEGKIQQRMRLPTASGAWAESADSVNTLIGDLVQPTAEIARVIESVARGDLSQTLALEIGGRPLCGEFLRIGKVVNTMVGQLGAFASEVSRVAREVGTDGRLGGQAQVPGVAGTWKDLTDNVNLMAANLTGQVRNIAEVTTAVAKGDLTKKITVNVRGEMLELKSTINTMVDQLNAFASEVSRVAREVGTDGRLGGQAKVPGAVGLWRDLTDNVNQLAANLTTQVRAIAEVATAVTKGDLTRSIMVQAQGEVAALKDNINEMIRNLKDTTLKNTEQDWLKTNLAKCTRMLQGHRDLVTVSRLVLSELAPLVNAYQGVFYACGSHAGERRLELMASYASKPNQNLPPVLRFGEGLVGQCACEKRRILLNDAPGDYLTVGSALGACAPLSVIILPVLFEGEVKAVIELASFRPFNETHLSFLDQLTESIGIVFNTIEAGMRTEDLLKQSQSLTRELQNQQEELKKTNDRLEQQAENLQRSEALLKKKQEELQATNEQLQEKAQLLSEQMRQVEYKNREVELAKAALEEKAEQLALSSRYKSEFLANMSHELRTPLNSLLILAKLLADNVDNNLNAKQIEYAQTIYAAGTDLLSLISDILDLAKIESGTVTLNVVPERFSELKDYVERTFRQVADSKQLGFAVTIDPRLPAFMRTDVKRLQQILKNLLSNAFKFTRQGKVSLEIGPASSGWTPGHAQLGVTDAVVAFSVTDTGVGIAADKQRVIFEAFQQADGTTSRQYGGTGLGLSISRELTRLLGGEIRVTSSPGSGSTFTLYLPLVHNAVAGHENHNLSVAPPAAHAENPAVQAANGAAAMAVQEAQETPPRTKAVFQKLAGRKVLIVDDDVRNIFALAGVLERYGITVLNAENGRDGIETLKDNPDTDAVLVDIMMPEFDGYDTIRMIRGQERFRRLPVIAITARAMLGDREKCLQAGASDYVAKPVDIEQLLAILAAWIAE